jgi:hypothetical protein
MTNDSILYNASKGFSADLASELIDSGVMDDLLPPQPAYQQKYRDTIRQVLFNLVRAHSRSNAGGQLVKVAIPLKKIYNGDGYWGQSFLSYRRIKKVLDVFEDSRLIVVEKGKPTWEVSPNWLHEMGELKGKVTRFFATGDLQQAIQNLLESRTDLAMDVEVIVDGSGVWMKDDGCVRWIEGREDLVQRVEAVNKATPNQATLHLPLRTPSSRGGSGKRGASAITVYTPPEKPETGITGHDEALRKCSVMWDWNREEKDSHIRYEVPERCLQFKRKYCRGSFDCGGRYYCYFQNIPSDWRKFVRLDGQPTVELDYDNLHFHMLYAEEGKTFTGDAYDIETPMLRGDVKMLASAIISARNHNQFYSWAHSTDDFQNNYTKEQITDAARRLKGKHQPIEDHFHTDAGIRLQNKDSEIAEQVMLETGAIGIHDGFLTKASKEAELRAVMKEAFAEAYDGYDIPVSREHGA